LIKAAPLHRRETTEKPLPVSTDASARKLGTHDG